MYQIGTLLLSEKVDARNDSVGHTDELCLESFTDL